jgi:hypothetical protein
VALALDVLGTYLTDFFKGIPGPKTVKLEIVVEKKRDRSCKMVRYEGGVSGINELPEVIRQLSDE